MVVIQPVATTDQHQVGRLQLVGEQIVDVGQVIKTRIGLLLGLQGCGIAHHAASGQRLAIHHGHHARHPGSGADLRPLEGLNQGQGQGQAARLHHDAVQLVSPLQQGLHGGQELILDGAAEATVGQLHHAALGFVVRTKPAAANQIAIDPHFPEFIHQHRKTQAAVEQQLAQEGGFTGTKEAGHHGDRQARLAVGAHLRTPGPTR